MKAVVDEALGDVSGPDAVLRLQAVAEDYFVHRSRLVWQLVDAFELLANVIGVQDSVFCGLAQTVRTVGKNVGKSAHKHAEVAVKGAHATNRLRAVVLEAELAVCTRRKHRRR